MYKKLMVLAGVLVSLSFSTERATLFCSFDAVAVGYESSSYTQKLLVTNAGVDGYLYNFRYPTGECYSGCSSNENTFQMVENPDKNAGGLRGHFSYNRQLNWSTTHGNVNCYIRRGWISDVQKVVVPDYHPIEYVDTVQTRPQIKFKQVSKIRDEELNALGRNIVLAMLFVGSIALLFALSD